MHIIWQYLKKNISVHKKATQNFMLQVILQWSNIPFDFHSTLDSKLPA